MKKKFSRRVRKKKWKWVKEERKDNNQRTCPSYVVWIGA
jgi:hypothetical protein